MNQWEQGHVLEAAVKQMWDVSPVVLPIGQVFFFQSFYLPLPSIHVTECERFQPQPQPSARFIPLTE